MFLPMVRDLPPLERPRERFDLRGAEAVSLQELIAISLNNGYKNKSAITIAEDLLSRFKSLNGIDSASIADLSGVLGVGYAKAVRLKAAIELGKRFVVESAALGASIMNSQQAFAIASYYLKGKMQEYLLLFCLNVRGGLIDEPEVISIGILDASCIHPREIFKKAIQKSAARIVLAHNHPSGSIEPSEADLQTTHHLYQAGMIMGIELTDHIITAGTEFCSLREQHPKLFSTDPGLI
jgi:DNA repair protein RadC